MRPQYRRPPLPAWHGGRGRSPSHRAPSWAPHQDRHLLRRGVFPRFTVPDGEGPAAVSHNEIVPILRLMMETVLGRLHLFLAHIRHIEGPSGRAYRLAGLQGVRGKFPLLFLQKLRHLDKIRAVTVVRGFLPIFPEHNHIRNRQVMAVEVIRPVPVQILVDRFQRFAGGKGRSIDQFIVGRVHGMLPWPLCCPAAQNEGLASYPRPAADIPCRY